jgi:hypothetical protein
MEVGMREGIILFLAPVFLQNSQSSISESLFRDRVCFLGVGFSWSLLMWMFGRETTDFLSRIALSVRCCLCVCVVFVNELFFFSW